MCATLGGLSELLFILPGFVTEIYYAFASHETVGRRKVYTAMRKRQAEGLYSHAKHERLGSYRWRVLVRKLLRCTV